MVHTGNGNVVGAMWWVHPRAHVRAHLAMGLIREGKRIKGLQLSPFPVVLGLPLQNCCLVPGAAPLLAPDLAHSQDPLFFFKWE